ncbi:unnamed protein product [Rotaria magnacalcarata]|uniref:EF-hand domain-containing protein n=1 Tax=Rotaria magnacalcarata TaxID=392030 RepID=A0A815BV53_9BILA|nr:unnamed protein product [Rotaria magnacalcarata]CAF1621103.1 unnamed protein product [Rotaria magnacalcarata]CAF2063876.1 unnamed protein product [Rotaria magnacalcarata]
MAFTRYYPVSSHIYDPAVAPTKPIQNVTAIDSAKFQNGNTARFDTTYRTEYINRLRNFADQDTKPTRQFKNSLNQYSVLPPISATNNPNDTTERKSIYDGQQPQQPFYDQIVPGNDTTQQLHYNSEREYYEQQQQQQQQQQQPMMNNEDSYLPVEPVLLTDFEENRLSEQIRTQLGSGVTVDRLKVLFQELLAHDANSTGYVHYSSIQSLTYQLGLHMADDTLRFAMCKFVSPNQPRGFVNYEDLIRFIGKCLSAISPNQYEYQQQQPQSQQQQQQPQLQQERNTPQRPVQPSANFKLNDDDPFDPDERQIRVLLNQNLKHFDLTGTIDFDKLTHELNAVDRNQSGFLNRQQVEEVVYKVRIPLQRSLIYQILEKHCRTTSKLYDWRAFVRYLQEQIFDIKQIQDRSSPVYQQYVPSRDKWLDDLQREFHEKDRLRIIERFISNNEGVRSESTHPTAWFTRFLRLANAMYTHRRNSNVSQDFVLPREEARRLFRAYNHIWDMKIDEGRMQKVFEGCSRNGHVVIDEALKQLAK